MFLVTLSWVYSIGVEEDIVQVSYDHKIKSLDFNGMILGQQVNIGGAMVHEYHKASGHLKSGSKFYGLGSSFLKFGSELFYN